MSPHSIQLLHHLLHTDAPVPLEQARRLVNADCSQTIGELIELGCDIEIHPQLGAKLIDTSLTVWCDYLESRHATGIGHNVRVYKETASTQQIAKQLIPSLDRQGCVVIADSQTAGRGRLGRRWFGPPSRCVLMTIVTDCKGLSPDRLVLATSCAIAKTVESFINRDVQIKWPNDVLIDSHKLSGVLVETVDGFALIGIGLNATLEREEVPQDVAQRVTSLTMHGWRGDRLAVIDALFTNLDDAIHTDDDASLSQYWRQRSSLLEQRITLESNNQRLRGRVLDIDPTGGLLLAIENGPVICIPASTATIVPEPTG